MWNMTTQTEMDLLKALRRMHFPYEQAHESAVEYGKVDWTYEPLFFFSPCSPQHLHAHSATSTTTSQQKALKQLYSSVGITATPGCCTYNGFQNKPEVRHSLWSSPGQGWACPMDLGCCRGAWMDIYNPGLVLHGAHCRIQASILIMGIGTHRKTCYSLKAAFWMPCCYILHDVPGT